MHSILSSRTSRPVISLLALGSLLLLSGCDLNFWTMKGHQSTIVADGPVAKSQFHVFMVTVYVTLVIFVIVVIKGLSLIFSGPEDFWDKYICNRR